MTRRPFLFAPILAGLPALLRAQAGDGVKALLQAAIDALAARNAGAFWLLFDPATPGYKAMRKDSQELLNGFDVTATVDFTKIEGSGDSRAVAMNWLLEIVSRTGARSRTTRRAPVECRVERTEGKWLIASFAPLAILAPPAVDGAWETIATASAALAQTSISGSSAVPDNAVEFLSIFDHAMPGYDQFSANLIALARAYQVNSSVELTGDSGDDTLRALTMDWHLDLISPVTTVSTFERDQTVTCQVHRQGNKWRVVLLDPMALFAPPLRP